MYHRAKKPILKFKQHEGLLETPEGLEAKQKYLVFARAVDAYITSLYEAWEKQTLEVATDLLKQPILAAVNPVPEDTRKRNLRESSGCRLSRTRLILYRSWL